MVTFAQKFETEMGPVVDVLADELHGLGVEVRDFGTNAHDVKHDFVYLQRGKDVRTTQFVGLSLSLLEFQGVEHCLSHIVLLNGLLLCGGIVVNDDELVPEEVELSSDNGSEVIVEAEHWARAHDGDVGESLLDDGFSFELGLEVEGRGVGLCAGS
jgi:hypothetical protein